MIINKNKIDPLPSQYYDEQVAFLDGKSVAAGTIHDRWMSYLTTLSSLTTGTMYDKLVTYLDAQGYTGTLNDKMMAWWKSAITPQDLSYIDTWREFLKAGGTPAVPSYLLLETGDKLLQESGDAILV